MTHSDIMGQVGQNEAKNAKNTPKKGPKTPPFLWTKKDLKNYLNISSSGVDRLLKKRAIKFYRINKTIRFKRYDVEQFLKKNSFYENEKK